MAATRAPVVGLCFATLVLAGCFAGEEPPPEGPEAPAGATLAAITDEAGRANLTVKDRIVAFQFFDEASGEPVPGLSVAVGLDETGSRGVLMIVDAPGDYPPRFVVLRGPAAAPVERAGLFSVSARAQGAETGDLLAVMLPRGPQTTLGEAVIGHLVPTVRRVQDALGLVDAAAAAANILDQSGLPLGRYAERLGLTETEHLTPEEATARLRRDLAEAVRDQLVSFTSTFEVPGLVPTALDLASLGLSANTILTCGLPGEKVAIRTAGPFQFVACEDVGLGDATGLVRVPVEGRDEFGQPLSKGSLELISRGKLGWGFRCPVVEGVAECEVPADDDYDGRVSATGFGPVEFRTGPLAGDGEFEVSVRLEPVRRLVLSLEAEPFQTTLLDGGTRVQFAVRVQHADGTPAACEPVGWVALPYIGSPGTTIDADTGVLVVGPNTGSVKVVARCGGFSSPARIVSGSGRAAGETPPPAEPEVRIAGTWDGTWRETTQSACQVGGGSWSATFSVDGAALSGDQTGLDDWDGPITGSVEGARVTWRLASAGPGSGADFVATGTVEGDAISGTFEDKCHITDNYGNLVETQDIRGTFDGRRAS